MVRPKSPVRLDWVDPAVCSLDYRLKIIGRLPFFKHLPADAISKIDALFHDRDVSADGRIYFEGDEADHLYLMAMGKVKLVRNTASGREVLLDILHGGDYFGSLTVLSGRNMAGADEAYMHTPSFYSDLFEFGYEAVGALSSKMEMVTDWQEPFQKGTIYYLDNERVRGVLLWNVWKKVKDATALLAEAGPFKAEDLVGRIQAE